MFPLQSLLPKIYPLLIIAVMMSVPSAAETPPVSVDMVLVLSLDVSASVDADEFRLMREGLARAISSGAIIDAVSSGQSGAIGVAVVQWSGIGEQYVSIGWMRLSGQASHVEFAGRIRNMQRRFDDNSTDLGGAIEHAAGFALSAPYETNRFVIDIAGDGTNNVNRSPQIARNKAVRAGVIINALAINDIPGGLFNYYRNFIIGGAGSFVETTKNFSGFENAIHKKLLREIGSRLLF